MKTTRRIVQFGFLALTLSGVFVFRANCERWCPFGGIEALHAYIFEGAMVCSLGTSNFFILGGVILTTLLLRRAFCGYMCPLGTISEWLSLLGRRLGIPTVGIPHKLDRALASLKYVVLAGILWFTWQVGELVFRGFDPCYALISRHGTDITYWAYLVAGVIAMVSLAMAMPFCRWFCPLAAVLNPISRFGLTRVKRDAAGCGDCGSCSKSCPMAIPVSQLEQITAARCISCMNCLEACPKRQFRALQWGPPDLLGGRWPQAVLVAVLLLCTSGAVASSYFFPWPSFVKSRGIPPARVATVRLKIENLTCRGRANQLFFFLERDDLYAIPRYFKLEAWPGPGAADVRITYDPTQTNELAIKRAITEPYYNLWEDAHQSACLTSPFHIEGYDPLSGGVEADAGAPSLSP